MELRRWLVFPARSGSATSDLGTFLRGEGVSARMTAFEAALPSESDGSGVLSARARRLTSRGSDSIRRWLIGVWRAFATA
jgi:hypothetical protein